MDNKLISISSKIIDVINESGIDDVKSIQYVLSTVFGYFQLNGASVNLNS